MNDSERIAKLVVETVLFGSRMEYREDQSDGSHDFDVHLPDGSLHALEVTAAVDQVWEETRVAVLDDRRSGPFIKARLCESDWYIHPARDARIATIREHADAYLRDIEKLGLERFFCPVHSFEYEPVRKIWEDLRVDAGSHFRWKTPGLIGLALPMAEGGIVTSAHVQTVVRAEATKEDNRKKLRASGAPQRHLFVFVPMSNFMPWVALRDQDPPQDPPPLTDEVTHIWAVAPAGDENSFVVWRGDKASWADAELVRG